MKHLFLLAGLLFCLQAARGVEMVASWGANQSGQCGVGHGGSDAYYTPQRTLGDTVDMVELACGGLHSLAVMADGTVQGWGGNSTFQLGQGALDNGNKVEPVVIPGVHGARSVAGGDTFSLAVLADHTVMGWGDNTLGQLGIPGHLNTVKPSPSEQRRER